MSIRHAVGIALIFALAACDFHGDDTGRPQRIAKDRAGNVYKFGTIDQVEGTRFFTVPIVRVRAERSSGSFTKQYGDNGEYNRLIVDSTTGANRRVLPNEGFEIVNWIEPNSKAPDDLTVAIDEVEGPSDGDKVTGGFYAAVVKRPRKTETDPDKYDVLLGRYENGQQVWIARDLAGVQSMWITPDRKIAMVAATADGGIFRTFDPATFKQLLESKLSL